jgi:hypothetical protein
VPVPQQGGCYLRAADRGALMRRACRAALLVLSLARHRGAGWIEPRGVQPAEGPSCLLCRGRAS